MTKVAIYGASGYTGQESLRLLLRHEGVRVTVVTSRRYKDMPVADVYPHFAGLTDLVFTDAAPEEIARQCDLVFLALPHHVSMSAAGPFLEKGVKVIDLSADFRLRCADTYERWYGRHSAPEILSRAVYGIPELYREEIRKADLVANPGCYPTSVILGLAPILKRGWIDPATIIVDSKSGVSGAGREPLVTSLFGEVAEAFKAYKVAQHRHTPEMEQELSVLAGQDVTISFTPHLLPVSRGILSTIYATLRTEATQKDVTALYREFYGAEPFVRVGAPGTFPNISSVKGSNYCDIGIGVDSRTKRVIIISTIDNLVKGAAGQAVQNMNLMLGIAEGTALQMVALFP
jgi:N-acetyl-gamma-glutamyl-phosphate reductase